MERPISAFHRYRLSVFFAPRRTISGSIRAAARTWSWRL